MMTATGTEHFLSLVLRKFLERGDSRLVLDHQTGAIVRHNSHLSEPEVVGGREDIMSEYRHFILVCNIDAIQLATRRVYCIPDGSDRVAYEASVGRCMTRRVMVIVTPGVSTVFEVANRAL